MKLEHPRHDRALAAPSLPPHQCRSESTALADSRCATLVIFRARPSARDAAPQTPPPRLPLLAATTPAPRAAAPRSRRRPPARPFLDSIVNYTIFSHGVFLP